MESIEELLNFPEYSVEAKMKLDKLDKERSMSQFDKLPLSLRDFINYNEYYVPVSVVYYSFLKTRNIRETIQYVKNQIKLNF